MPANQRESVHVDSLIARIDRSYAVQEERGYFGGYSLPKFPQTSSKCVSS